MKVENLRNKEIDLAEDVEVEDTYGNPLSNNFPCVCQASPAIVITELLIYVSVSTTVII